MAVQSSCKTSFMTVTMRSIFQNSVQNILILAILWSASAGAVTAARAAAVPFTPSRPATWAQAEEEKEKQGEARESNEKAADESASASKERKDEARRCGRASWYMHGSRTANGERFVPAGLTAAHRSMPFGTRLKVTDPAGKRSVTVRINDRGPFIHGRVLDLSRGAAQALGVVGRGVADVCYVVLK